MRVNLSSGFKTQFLGVIPYLKDDSGALKPEEIVSLSGILTFRGYTLKDILRRMKIRKESLKEKVKAILQASSLRGHASMSTTPSLCLTFEGSKFLDSSLTGIIFSSSMMASGRRTDTSIKDIIYPDGVFKKTKCQKIYREVSRNIIETFNYFLSNGAPKDDASKILQYGIHGTGIIQLPIESIVAISREYESEKEWMPEEVGILLKQIKNYLKKQGVGQLFATRQAAPAAFYPYPNIFKDPSKPNLVRSFAQKQKSLTEPKLISFEALITPEFKRKMKRFENELKVMASSLKRTKIGWQKLLQSRQEILRDYYLSLNFKFLSSVAWRVWGEKKRHRTCPMIIESIYYSIERTAKIFQSFKKRIERGRINEKMEEGISRVFSIPPSIKNNKVFLTRYLTVALKSFDAYKKLLRMGIKPREAIFLIPRAVKIDVLQEYNFYNLLAGYYPLRLCSTVEEELRTNTLKEVSILKGVLEKKKLRWLSKIILPKCGLLGFCPERESCGQVKIVVEKYDRESHEEMAKELNRNFKKNLANI
ncbi:MAG: FAD-dependent thymidylate synthase [Patescibacteria group bacterium]